MTGYVHVYTPYNPEREIVTLSDHFIVGITLYLYPIHVYLPAYVYAFMHIHVQFCTTVIV